MPKILVKNSEARVHSIGIRGGEPIILLPGWNEVDADAWGVVAGTAAGRTPIGKNAKAPATAASPLIRDHYLAKKLLIVHEAPAADDPFKDMPTATAVSVLAETYDAALLTRIKARDGRPELQQAIVEQLAAIAKAGSPTGAAKATAATAP